MNSEPSRDDLVAQIAELHGEVLRLGRVKDELDWTEDALKRRTRLLSERVKELECVYDVVRLVRSSAPADKKLQDVADRLPAAWQHPEKAGARLSLAGREFFSARRPEPAKRMEAPILDAGGKKAGFVEVAYAKGAEFLPEESALLQVVAQLLGLLA